MNTVFHKFFRSKPNLDVSRPQIIGQNKTSYFPDDVAKQRNASEGEQLRKMFIHNVDMLWLYTMCMQNTNPLANYKLFINKFLF